MDQLSRTIFLKLRSLLGEDQDRGASLVEYALLVALIAIVCFVAVEVLGGTTSQSFDDFNNSLTAAQD